MRGVFLGQSGPYSPTVLRGLLGCEHIRWGLVVEGRRASAGTMRHRLRRDRPTEIPAGSDLCALARAAGIDVLQTMNVNEPTALKTIRDARPDLLVCAGYDRLFSPEVLQTAQAGINLHPSLLPKWRGPAPLFWAAKHGDEHVGLTVHTMDRHEDHGPLLAQQVVEFSPGETGPELFTRLARVGAPMLDKVLAQLATRCATPAPQDHTLSTRARRPKPEDAQVVPTQWACQHLVDFVSVAPVSRAAWVRLADDVFHLRRGLRAAPGERLPAEYVLAGTELVVQCRDGVAYLEIQH